MKSSKKIIKYVNKWEWLILLLGLVVLLRIPSLFEPHHYGDEEIYFVMGRAWRWGVPFYSGAFDHKPPLIYILAGIANNSVFWIRMILMIWMLVHTVIFWHLAEWFWGKRRKWLTFMSTLIFVIITTLPRLEGQIANGELFMMMPVTAAFLLVSKDREKNGSLLRYFLAGILCGIGLLFKVPVILDFLALVLLVFVFSKDKFIDSLKSLVDKKLWILVLGFVTPVLLSFLYYYFNGMGQDYLRGALLINFGYTSSYSTSSYDFNPFASGLFLRALGLGGFTLFVYALRKKLSDQVVFATVWFGWSLFGALLSARPYPHYLLQPAVPAALGLPLIFTMESVIEWLVFSVVTLSTIIAHKQINFWYYPTLSYYQNFIEAGIGKKNERDYINYFSNSKLNYKLAKSLNEKMNEGDGLYVWGTDSTLYNLTDTLPAGGRYIVSFHVRDFNAYKEVMDNLQKNPPRFIVIMPDPIEFGELFGFLESQYQQIEKVDGAIVYMKL